MSQRQLNTGFFVDLFTTQNHVIHQVLINSRSVSTKGCPNICVIGVKGPIYVSHGCAKCVLCSCKAYILRHFFYMKGQYIAMHGGRSD